MNLHEYQGKEILKEYGVPTQEGYVAETLDEAINAYGKLQQMRDANVVVVKAQIHAGGRGKGGGVKLAKNLTEVQSNAKKILGMMLKTPQTPGGVDGPGKKVNKILIAEDSFQPTFDSC